MLFLSFIMYEALWAIIEIQYNPLDYSPKDILLDFGICALFTLVSFILKYCFAKFSRKKYSMSLAELITQLLICSILTFIIDKVFFSQYNTNNSLGNILDAYIICIICSFFSVINTQRSYYNQYIKMKQEQERLRLTVLQQQLSPHFMFNSLSTLQGVILSEPSKAEIYLNALSVILRYFTENIGKEKVLVKDAMQCIDYYTFILETRFPQHFLFNIVVDNIPLDSYILPVSIQAAIENAVKHNKHSQKSPLKISITNDEHFIVVTNYKQLLANDTESLGIGLSNLKERYNLLTKYEVCVCETEKIYSIKIPIIYESTHC